MLQIIRRTGRTPLFLLLVSLEGKIYMYKLQKWCSCNY